MLQSNEAFYRMLSMRMTVFLAFFGSVSAFATCKQANGLQSTSCASASTFVLFITVVGLLTPLFWGLYDWRKSRAEHVAAAQPSGAIKVAKGLLYR
jgi:hypothetical protein